MPNINTIMEHASRRVVRFAALSMLTLTLAAPLGAQQQEPYKATDEGVTKPRLVSKVDPDYTPEAKDARVQGTVSISAVVERSGHVDRLAVVKGVDPGLDLNALAAVRQWIFEPGTKDGQPVAVEVMIEVTFHLK